MPYHQTARELTEGDSASGASSSNGGPSASNSFYPHLHVSHQEEGLPFNLSSDTINYSNKPMCSSRKRKIPLVSTAVNHSDKKQKGIYFFPHMQNAFANTDYHLLFMKVSFKKLVTTAQVIWYIIPKNITHFPHQI